MLDYKIKQENNKIIIIFKPILTKKEVQYIFESKNLITSPCNVWFTATYNMKDFIGNIIDIKKDFCSVKGVYYGKMQEIRNVKIIDSSIKNIGERVMITEHIDIDGKLELIATKYRILYADVNFINFGWFNNWYMRIDIYTGNYKMIGV